MPSLWCRCAWCDQGFMFHEDHDECPRCKAEWKRQQAQMRGEIGVESTPWKFSRGAMQERLSVSGDRDE